jgi:hypothetical protein
MATGPLPSRALEAKLPDPWREFLQRVLVPSPPAYRADAASSGGNEAPDPDGAEPDEDLSEQ